MGTILLFHILNSLMFAQEPSGAVAVAIEDIQNAISSRDNSIHTFSVDVAFRIQKPLQATGKNAHSYASGRIIYDRVSGWFVLSSAGRYARPPSRELGKKEDWTEAKEEIIAYDGAQTKKYTKSEGATPTKGEPVKEFVKRGLIYQGRETAWIIDPEKFVGSLKDAAIGKNFDIAKTYRVVEDDEKPSRILLEAINEKFPDGTNRAGRARIRLDPTRGMGVESVEYAIKQSGASSWTPYYRAIVLEWVQVEERSLPAKYLEEFFDVKEDGSINLIHRIDAMLSKWEINRSYPSSVFRVAFDQGTIVKDMVRKIEYMAGTITDSSLRRMAEETKQLQARLKHEEEMLKTLDSPVEETNWRRAAYLAVSACCIAALLAIVFHISRRRGGAAETLGDMNQK